jgi:anti-sigma factor RsiW
MSTASEQNERMIAYFLGELPDEQSLALEEQYLSDERLFRELLAVEAELRDSYARGVLSPDRQQRFGDRLLKSEAQQRRLEFSRALLFSRALPEVTSPQRRRMSKPIRIATGIAAAFLIAIALGWTAWRRDVPKSAAPAGTAANEKVVAFNLIPGSTRGAAGEVVVEVPAGTDLIQLKAEVDQDSYASYQGVLRTPEGLEILRKRGLLLERGGASRMIVLDVPASLLRDGHYTVTLSGEKGRGSEDIADYSFRLAKR